MVLVPVWHINDIEDVLPHVIHKDGTIARPFGEGIHAAPRLALASLVGRLLAGHHYLHQEIWEIQI